MSILQFFAGAGKRRKSVGNWDELEQKLSTAEARAKHVKGANRYECAAHIHPPFWAYSTNPLPCPWCEIGKLRGQLELLTMRPAPRPDAVAVKAPADPAAGVVTRPTDEPVSDITAETQAVDVRDLRAAVGEGDTRTDLPVVTAVVPLHLAPLPPVTWGPGRDLQTAAIEANLSAPAPTPEYAATAVPRGIGDVAHDKVSAALDEAS